jgi:peptide/nickel transport system ATP-binding protein
VYELDRRLALRAPFQQGNNAVSLAPAAQELPEKEPLEREMTLEVRGLRIERVHSDGSDTIVNSLDLSLAAGETIGIVGESGSGKSMTARAIIGLLPPKLVAHGEILYGGRDLLALGERELRMIRGREIGLILQDPFTMLNPVFRCGRILGESLLEERGRRMGRRERRAEVIRRLAEVGLTDETVVGRYPFQLSGGMRQRVAIAAALARDPRVLIADEPSTALDVTTQREILTLLRVVQEARGMGLMLITHDLRVAFAMCDRVYVLYAGSLVEVAAAADLDAEPLHPYTQGLLLSEPPASHRVRELVTIPGAVPAPDEVAACCTFAPRCRWVQPICREGAPPLREVAPGRLSACIRVREIRAEMAVLRERAEADAGAPPQQRLGRALIEVRDAYKFFQTGSGVVSALEGVSIEVGENESVGLVGESGSGKTTLARILVGLESASRGEVLIDGVDVADWSKLRKDDRRRLRGVVQIVFQDPYSSLNPMRTVGSTLSEAITTHHPAARNLSQQVRDLLLSVGLPNSYAQRKPVALSGGERQRVAIARALAVKPRILICDEPVSALDMSVQAQILNLFATLRHDRGIGYLFITHDLSIVRQVVEHVYVMYRGRIVEEGPVEDVLNQPRDAYTIKLLQSVPRSEADALEHAGD